MQARLLAALNAARKAGRARVLFTRLRDGAQQLYDADEKTPAAALTEEMRLLAREALRLDRSRSVALANEQWFMQVFNPPLRLIIVGAVHIAQMLVPMAHMAAYEVIVVDPRAAFARAARFPSVKLVSDWPDVAMQDLAADVRTAIVALTHDPKLDDPALAAALRSPAFYIGALGSRKTQQARYERLARSGFTAQDQARIHGPIGLDIGAESPAEIALAIMAEITASLRQGKA